MYDGSKQWKIQQGADSFQYWGTVSLAALFTTLRPFSFPFGLPTRRFLD
jgi:hypothetical protein